METVAVEKKGFKRLSGHLAGTASVPTIPVGYPQEIENAIERISLLLPECPIRKRALALMFLSNPTEARDSFETVMGRERAAEAMAIADTLQEQFSNPLGYIIGVSRSRAVDRLLDAVYLKDMSALGAAARTAVRRKQTFGALLITLFSLALYLLAGVEKLGDWGVHPTLLHVVSLMFLFAVLPYRALEKLTTHAFLGTLFLVEILYLMYKFVGVFGAGTLVDAVQTGLFGKHLLPLAQSGLDRIGAGPFVRDLLLGQYGLVSMGLTYAIAIVMPIVATFFFAFGVLEDSGYLPRLSVIADRTMRKIGLNGKAVLPMVLGLGCATMATLTTRILDSKKERIIATLLLALDIPCSAQLGVLLAIVSQCSPVVTAAVIGMVLAQLFIVGALSARLIPGRRGDFIVELPPLRPPLMLNILTKSVHRLKWFLMEAVPLFLAGTLLLFIIERAGVITMLERTARPVIDTMLGLPVESTFAFIVGFFRRDYGAAGLYDLFKGGMLSNNQVAVSMVVMTLFVPCIANFFVMIKERGFGTALAMAAFILPYAILVGTVLNVFFKLTGIVL
ncbi:MAG: ferrous iron transporter B [Chitinivibrionia bacterium]|nr:ferrous iron transporter B [Chitinivibrionia bacterium]